MVSYTVKLEKATADNQLFERLETQWEGFIAEYNESLDDYIAVYRQHARNLIADEKAHSGVYILMHNEACEAFMHLDYCKVLKGYDGSVLRLPWFYLAPRFDFDEQDDFVIASVIAGLLVEITRFSQQMGAKTLKLRLGNAFDRKVLVTAATAVYSREWNVSYHGLWLQMEKK